METCASFRFMVLMTVAGLAGGVARAEDLPRYRLEVGQQIVFHGERHIQVTATATEDIHSDWKVDVAGQNADGSWRVVSLVDAGGTYVDGKTTMPVERVVEAGVCDVYADGRIGGEDDPLINLARLFPRLPATEKELAGGWDDQTADHARIVHFERVAAGNPEEVFGMNATPKGGIVGVFEPESRQSFQVERKAGLVKEIQVTSSIKGQPHSQWGEIRRTGVRNLETPVLQKVAAAAKEYDAALAVYKAAVAAWATGGKSQQEVNGARDVLDKASQAVVATVFTDGGPTKPDLKNVANAMVPDAPSAADILNQPAPEWTAVDLEGRKHSMSEFRGKVVLMDFGSRGCTWCIREMPQLERLAQSMKDKPVVVLSMALDTDRADAKFVADALQVPYMTIMAAEAYKGYPVEGTPTVVIVDGQGIMRRRFVGYSMLGYEEFKANVEMLLKKGP